MLLGKKIRLKRILENGKMLCIPMDHGLSSGPLKGIENMDKIIQKIELGGATSTVLNKGIIKSLNHLPNLGLIMHLSGSTSLGNTPNWKVKVGDVKEALKLGADGVSVHINIGGDNEPEMLSKLAEIANESDTWGVPFLAMMYPRGENLKSPHDPETIAHVTRIGAELGADIVKTTYTGDPDSFRLVVESCPVPVVIAGGPKMNSDTEVLEMVEGAMEAGAIGVTFGRNVFQHKNPTSIVKALSMLIKQKTSVNEALEALK